jgi:hypothetical protein
METRGQDSGVSRGVGFVSPVSVRAFATLAAVGLLVLTAALLGAAVLSSRQILLDQSRAEESIDARSTAWKTARDILGSLQESWNADEQTLDNWWLQHAPSFPAGSDLVSLSGRVNLNSMTPFLLQHSELSGTLFNRSVEDFITYRMNGGPYTRVEDYKDYFQPAALKSLYSVQSQFNINTADEIMLEKVLSARTGSTAFASTIRARVREFRANRQIIAPSDLESMIGSEKDTVGDLVTTNPELDVNTAPLAVLLALLRDPDLRLNQPDAKLQLILAGRASKPLTDEALRQSLGVDKSSLLLQYLGTRCRFVLGAVPGKNLIMTFVVNINYSTDSPPKLTLRILDTRWKSP